MRTGTFPGGTFSTQSSGGGTRGTNHFGFGGMPPPFMPGNPNGIWEQFVMSESMGGGAGGGGLDGFDFDFGFPSSPLGGRQSHTRVHREPHNGRSKTPETTVIERPIAFSLEEYGCPHPLQC